MSKAETKAGEILSAAQSVIQTRGYNGFSFRDIAARVGIKSASIHYHFPTKADLAAETASAYRAAFADAIEASAPASAATRERLAAYAGLFVQTLQTDNRLCLCGALASEIESLSEPVRAEVVAFFDEQRSWIAGVVRDGQARGEVAASHDPDQFANTYFAALEGAMIVARAVDRPQDLPAVADQMISLLVSDG